MSYWKKIFISLVGIFSLAVVGMGLVSFFSARRYFFESVSKPQSVVARDLVNQIGYLVDERVNDVVVLGSMVEVMGRVEASGSAELDVGRMLTEASQESDQWNQLSLFKDGQEVAASGEGVGFEVEVEALIDEMIQASDGDEEVLVGNVFVNPEGKLGRLYATRLSLSDEGGVWLVAEHDWMGLFELLASGSSLGVHLFNEEGYEVGSSMVDKAETMLTHDFGGSELLRRARSDGGWAGLGRGIHGDESMVVAVESFGSEVGYGMEGWVVIVEKPLAAVIAPLRGAALRMLLETGAVFGVFVVVVILTLMRLVVLPIDRLVKKIRKISSGEMNAAEVSLSQKGELGEVENAFGQLARSVQLSQANLRKVVDERTQELQQTRQELEKQQDALLNVLEDVSEEKEYTKTQGQSVLQTIGEAIVITDDAGRVKYVNPKFEQLLGFANTELVDREYSSSLKAFDLTGRSLDATEISDSAAVTASEQKRKMLLATKDGQKLAIMETATPMYMEREFLGVIRVIHDYTEDLMLQRQKDDFFSIASHELRTPLTVIAGNLDMILDGTVGGELPGETKEVLADASQATDRLIKIVNTFLNVSRIDQGRIKMNVERLNFCEVINSVVEEMRPLIEKGEVKLVSTCPVEEVLIDGDVDKIKEILINLIGNSGKFTNKGEINIGFGLEKDFVEVRVRDTGLGIEKEKQGLLFNRFQQAMSRTLSREAGGTGLGLYISREFARLMGGDLVLAWSEYGKGSEFVLRLPVQQAESSPEKENSVDNAVNN